MNAVRVHPLAALTRPDLDAYLAAHEDALLNPLHAMGFPTIGCFPCTTPVLPDEPERAGRWRHLASVAYCGINPVDRGGVEGAIEIDDRYAAMLA
jgi:phosphoadenosine phosphosulfate reductase